MRAARSAANERILRMTGQMNREKTRFSRTPRGMLVAATLCAPLLAVACGSVGSNTALQGSGGSATDAGGDAPQGSGGSGTGGLTGSGGSPSSAGGNPGSGGSGTGGASMGGAGGSIVDAGVDQVKSDAADGGPLPTSCAQIKQQNPAAVSGVFTIAPLGTAQNVFCEMTVDNGGWTAFYVGDNGNASGGNHFESAADSCPDPANQCLRRLPSTMDITHDFAVKCGLAVVKFKLGALSLDYFKNGLEHQWQPLTNAVAIDVGLVGKANLVINLWTGDTNNLGWIVSGSQSAVTSAFANGYTTNTLWNYCNGSTQPDSSSRVMLFYR
jgi:hypothetical protein